MSATLRALAAAARLAAAAVGDLDVAVHLGSQRVQLTREGERWHLTTAPALPASTR